MDRKKRVLIFLEIIILFKIVSQYFTPLKSISLGPSALSTSHSWLGIYLFLNDSQDASLDTSQILQCASVCREGSRHAHSTPRRLCRNYGNATQRTSSALFARRGQEGCMGTECKKTLNAGTRVSVSFGSRTITTPLPPLPPEQNCQSTAAHTSRFHQTTGQTQLQESAVSGRLLYPSASLRASSPTRL